MTQDGSNSLGRGLKLLSEIVRDGGETPFPELAGRLGIPLSTAYRLLAELVRNGFAMRMGAGRFGPGLRSTLLHHRVCFNDLLARQARPLLRTLSARTNLTAHLGIFEEGMVTYLVRVAGRSSEVASFTREGMQLEAYCSAVGKVLLSGQDEDVLQAYLKDGPFIELTRHTLVHPDEILRAVETARIQGYAIDDREVVENMYCVSVPVRSGDGRLLCAISISALWQPQIDTAVPGWLNALRDCAMQLEALGGA